jgi:hypothetical protein
MEHPANGFRHTDDGTTRRVDYRAGETRHFSFPGDEYILHDLHNDGPSELAFLTSRTQEQRDAIRVRTRSH